MKKSEQDEILVPGTGTPPFVAWKTFESFIERLKKTGVPGRIDGAVMNYTSGGIAGQLKTTLRYFGHISSCDYPTEALHSFVAAYQTEGWKRHLVETLTTSYAHLLSGLDLAKITSVQLKDQFREKGGIEGETVDKAQRFLVAACQQAEIEVSPYLTMRRGRRPGLRHKPERRLLKERTDLVPVLKKEPERAQSPGFVALPEQPHIVRRLVFPIPGKLDAVLDIPEDVTPDECQILSNMLLSYSALRYKPPQHVE